MFAIYVIMMIGFAVGGMVGFGSRQKGWGSRRMKDRGQKTSEDIRQ